MMTKTVKSTARRTMTMFNVAAILALACLSVRAADDRDAALFKAVSGNNIRAARAALIAGANANALDGNGFEPLSVAAGKGNTGMAKLLLNSGARIDQPDGNIDTPLMSSVKNHQFGMTAYLLAADANPRINAADDSTVIMSAMRLSVKLPEPLLKAFIAKGVDINAQNKQGDTALILAVDAGNAKNVRQLLANDANPALKNAKRRNALQEAIEKKPALVPMLQNAMEQRQKPQ